MHRRLDGGVLLFSAVLLFFFPGESAQAAKEGVRLCLDLLIPSLFPFFVLSSLLIETGTMLRWSLPLRSLFQRLSGVGEAGAAAFVLGILGGYPLGVRSIAQLRERGECTPAEAQRLALFCNNCGPAFYLGAVGTGIFGSRNAGLLLFASNLLSALLLALLLRFLTGAPSAIPCGDAAKPGSKTLSEVFPFSVQSAFTGSLSVSAYVLLFSVLTALTDQVGLLPFLERICSLAIPGDNNPVLIRGFLVGLLELSTGTATLKAAATVPAALPLSAFILSWGGLSVYGQSLPYLRSAGVSSKKYLAAKLCHGLLSAGIVSLWTVLFPISLPAMAQTVWIASPSLLAREICVIWCLAGLYYLLFPRKRAGKVEKKQV